MTRIYSYIVRSDNGAAPNPFWDVCTLTICKPAIRRNAQIGDWVVGTGSKNAKCNDGEVYDLSDSLVYAMKISDIKTLREYDIFCKSSLLNKIPRWKTNDWRFRVGDCIYDFSDEQNPSLRTSVHDETHRKRDLSGENALLSDHFYYFGEEARPIPSKIKEIIKKNQGHKKIEDEKLVAKFEKWANRFEKNKIYADPQKRWLFDKVDKIEDSEISCSANLQSEKLKTSKNC